MPKILSVAVLALLTCTLGMSSAGPPTAQQVLDGAKAQAAAQHKSVFLLFEASW